MNDGEEVDKELNSGMRKTCVLFHCGSLCR